MDGLHSVALLHLQQVVRRQRHMMGDKSTISVQYVMGEGTWGRRRSVPVMDGVKDFLERYLTFRAERLRTLGIESEAMFPPLRSDREFMRQQSFGRLKEREEKMLDVRFEFRDGHRANGQRMFDVGHPIKLVSKSMGMRPSRPSRSSTRTTRSATFWTRYSR